MGKTYVTQQIESLLFNKYFIGYSHRCAFEVPSRGGRVDFVSRAKDGTLTFIEIKQSLSDFRSKHGHNLHGDKNYYAMPLALYEKVKDKIPRHVGVLVIETLDFGVLGYNKFQMTVIKQGRKVNSQMTPNTRKQIDKALLTSCNSTINRLLRSFRYEITNEEKAAKHFSEVYV